VGAAAIALSSGGFNLVFPEAHAEIDDWLMRLPEELEQQLWRALQAEEETRKMRYVSSVQRIGRQEGLREGLDSERHLLLRQVRRRFGEAVAADSAPLLARIARPAVLEDLGKAVLECADGAVWRAALAERAATP
jgi:hypothetical protein